MEEKKKDLPPHPHHEIKISDSLVGLNVIQLRTTNMNYIE